MATGIVSTAMDAAGHEAISRALIVATAVAWIALGATFLRRLRRDRARWRREAGRPSALTAVTGTAVLGTGLAQLGWPTAGWAVLVIASGLCMILMRSVLRVKPLPSAGLSFLLVVAPQSLAVLLAALAEQQGTKWPAFMAMLPFAAGLCAYPVVLARFDLDQVRRGAGDQWVAGGALAISTLACADIAAAATSGAIHEALRIGCLVLWVATIGWLPVLLGSEVRWPRTHYDVRRWATVFPLGMYAAMSVDAGRATGINAIASFGKGWAWVALAAWAATAIGLVRRLSRERNVRRAVVLRAR